MKILPDMSALLALSCIGVAAPNLPASAADLAASQASLQYFAGAWKCDGEFPSSGRKISSTIRFEKDANSGTMLKHHDDDPPNLYHAIELWAADKSGAFHDTIADPFGGVRQFTSPGWTGGTFAWTTADATAVPRERFSYTRLGDSTMRVDWSVSKDGIAYAIGDTLICKRA